MATKDFNLSLTENEVRIAVLSVTSRVLKNLKIITDLEKEQVENWGFLTGFVVDIVRGVLLFLNKFCAATNVWPNELNVSKAIEELDKRFS